MLTFAAWRTQSQRGAVQNIGPVQQHPLSLLWEICAVCHPGLMSTSWWMVQDGPRTCFRPWLLCVEIRRAGVRKLTSKLSKIYAWKGQLINWYLRTLNANKRRWTLYFILQDISTGNGVLPFWEVLPLPKGSVIRLLSRKKECTHTYVAYIHLHP